MMLSGILQTQQQESVICPTGFAHQQEHSSFLLKTSTRVRNNEAMGRHKAAWQLFCNPCIALRFDRCIKSMINQVEPQMGMQNLTNCFMVNVSIKQYIETVSLTIASWLLDLFGPNVVQKPWNYHRHFVALLRKRGKKLHLWKCSRCR